MSIFVLRLRSFMTVVYGATTVSSWSWPIVLPPFVSRHADDAERKVLDADHLPDRVLVAEERVGDRRSQQADFRRGPDFRVSEEGPLVDVPGADERPLDADALNGRAPVEVPVDDLSRGAHHRRDVGDGRTLAADGGHVVVGDGGLAGEDARSRLRRDARKDHQEVRPERGDLRLNRGLRALARRRSSR